MLSLECQHMNINVLVLAIAKAAIRKGSEKNISLFYSQWKARQEHGAYVHPVALHTS